jgi:mannose-6-phosphate isomerase-like protein (cupin superfamily)
MSRRGSKRIDTVAAEIATAAEAGTPACLVLGAGCSKSSGIPLWEEFAAQVLVNLEVDDPTGERIGTSVDRLQEHLKENPFARDLVVHEIDQRLREASPSRGYRYLAKLISEGYYKTVISTNWDSILEDCLYRYMRADDIVIVARDSAPDDYIAKAIENSGNRLVVVKLHGDPKGQVRTGEGNSTRSLSRELLEVLSSRLTKVHLVGTSGHDLDVLQLLFRRIEDADVLAVSPDPEQLSQTLQSVATSVIGGLTSVKNLNKGQSPTEEPPKVNIGEFDHFFCQLTLSVERRRIRTPDRSSRLKHIEESLLRKEEVGLSYINSSQLTRMARAFVGQVTRLSSPDIVFFVNDPTAPGGMELKKRIEAELVQQNIIVGVLHIEGEKNNRSFRRSFRGPSDPDLELLTGSGKDVTTVHILDSITFSGNTLKIAKEQVSSWYPSADVRLGALVVSQMLLERQADLPTEERIYYDSVTDRFEIFFPWGVTQTTADFDRKFPGVSEDRLVHIARRPWGAIEVLVDEEMCSVRLLTIEAGRRLSFQRHLCRDELFVALDDNIGLDVCAADLQDNAHTFDPAVKSMVLEKGDYILIPRGVWHRTKASMDRARLLEVAFGVYDQQYDIERLFDDFDRINSDGAS